MWDFIFKILAFIFVGLFISYVTVKVIDVISIRREAKKKYAEAIKAIVKSKDVKTVKIGLYGESDNYLDEMTIKAEDGVSNSIYIGQVITI